MTFKIPFGIILDLISLGLLIACCVATQNGWFKSSAESLAVGGSEVKFGTLGKCFYSVPVAGTVCISYGDLARDNVSDSTATAFPAPGFFYPLLNSDQSCCQSALRGLGIATLAAMVLAALFTVAAIVVAIIGAFDWEHGLGIAAGFDFVTCVLAVSATGMMWGWFFTNSVDSNGTYSLASPAADWASILIIIVIVTSLAGAVTHLFMKSYDS